MWPFKQLFNLTTKEPVNVIKNWRNGMWVVASGNRVGVLYKLGDPCEVHLVNPTTGETTNQISCQLTELRQAKFGEIPECRRGITKERAEALGYGT